MKNTIWVVVVILLAFLSVLEFRYALVVNSPIVAKIDRITGDVWIANSGMWLKVQHIAKKEVAAPSAVTPKQTQSPMQSKTK